MVFQEIKNKFKFTEEEEARVKILLLEGGSYIMDLILERISSDIENKNEFIENLKKTIVDLKTLTEKE